MFIRFLQWSLIAKKDAEGMFKKLGLFWGLMIGFGVTFSHPVNNLQALYQIIETNNPEYYKTYFDQQAKKHDAEVAKSGFYPQIAGSYSYGRNRSVLPGVPYRTAWGSKQFLFARQLLFDGGKIYHQWLGALGDYEAARAQTAAILNTLGYELAEVYFNIRRLNHLVALSRQNVGIHMSTYDKMQSRFSSGAAAQSEVTLARARLAAARARLYAFQGDLKNAKYRIEKLIGKPTRVRGNQPIPSRHLPKTFKKAIDLALQSNWQVVIAKENLHAAHQRVLQQKARFWFPDVSLQVTGDSSTNYSTLRGTSRDLQGSVVVDYAFFEGGRYTAEYNKFIKLESSAKEAFRQTLRTTKELIQSDWNDLQVARRRVRAITNHVYSIRKTVAFYKKEFEIGKRSLLNVLDLINELYLTRTRLADARFQVHADTFSILASTGQLVDVYHYKKW